MDRLLRVLAEALLSGDWTPDAAKDRLRTCLRGTGQHRWITPLIQRVWQTFGDRVPGTPDLLRFLHGDLKLHQALASRWEALANVNLLALPSPPFRPRVPQLAALGLPELRTPGALADWLQLTPGELDWFADVHSRERKRTTEAGRHYRYRWIRGSRGKLRLVETPKPRLKALQRQIDRGMLKLIPVHAAAHGFVPRRSVVTYLQPHQGQRAVLHFDLANFFATLRRPRVEHLFGCVGYPNRVASLLAGLCTNCVPVAIVESARPDLSLAQLTEWRSLLGSPHLPQGAPTSPALANLCAYRLDCRLSGLAQAAGLKYTRYADDLVFSGGEELHRRQSPFRIRVLSILCDEGFTLRARKTQLMLESHRQQVAGLVINRAANVPRDEYDRLRAMLHNCARFGPDTQNRDAVADFRAHLLGRIGYVAMTNPRRGERLQQLFAAISWGR
jgi:hypothetical protein